MKKNGFTLLEVVLAVTLFGLMIGVILQAYTSIQLGNAKSINTQKTIEVSEGFFEKINDMSTDYVIDVSKYSGSTENIINTGSLRLKSTVDDNQTILYTKDCSSGNCYPYMKTIYSGSTSSTYGYGGTQTGDEIINLSKYEEVTVDYLNFEIYLDKQYVNINIITKTPGGETLQGDQGITLTTTVGFKTYEKYEGELTAETLCEDVCSVSNIGNTGMKQSTINMANNSNNITNDACTLGVYKSSNNSLIFGLFDGLFNIFGNHNYDHQDIYTIASECNKGETTRCRSHCNIKKAGTNPYNCGYIRKTITSGGYISFSNSGHQGLSGCQIYNAYVMNFACEDMCMSSIFSCLDEDEFEDPLQKRTGIRVKSGEFAGYYIQNPKLNNIPDAGTFQNGTWTGQNGWSCTTGSLKRKSSENNLWAAFRGAIVGTLEFYWECTNTGIIYCDGTYYGNGNSESAIYISDDEYYKNCIKWTWSPNGSTTQKTGKRYVYSNETQNGTSCVCDVDYKYSLNAGGFIESGNCGGLQKVRGEGYGSDDSFDAYDYMPKKANLIYVDGALTNSKKRIELTGFQSWVGVNAIIDDAYCQEYDNGVCSKTATFNGKNYKVAGESGLYFDSFSSRDECGCSNDDYYDCVGTCSCSEGAEHVVRYKSGHNVSEIMSKKWYCNNILSLDTGLNYGNSGNVLWTGGDCKVRSGDKCVGGIETGYNYVELLTGAALRERYCGVGDSSGDGFLTGRDSMVGDSRLDPSEKSRYTGYTYFCQKKTDECRNESNITISSGTITPESYCEDILSGVVGTYEFNTDDFGLGILLEQRSYTENLSGCLYSFSGVKKTIDNNTANDWYCKQTGYDLGWNGSNCEKCTLRGNEKQIKSSDANDRYCKNKLGYDLGWNGSNCEKCTLSGNEKQIKSGDANDWYCKQIGYDLGWNGSKCEKCTLRGTKVDTGNAKQWYCNSISWNLSGNNCIKKVDDNEIKKYYCDNNSNKYTWNGSDCKRKTTNKSIDINDANQYYCSNHSSNTILKSNICYYKEDLTNRSDLDKDYCLSMGDTRNDTYKICYHDGMDCLASTTQIINQTGLNKQYCESLGNKWSSTYNLCYSESDNCLKTTTQIINQTGLNKQYCESLGNKWSIAYNLCYSESDNCLKTATQPIDQAEAKQQYCINSGYNRNNVYGCRTTGDGTFSGIIPLNYFEKRVIYGRFIVALYDTYHFDGIDNLYLNTLSDSDKKLICNKVLNKPWLNIENFYDPFKFRRNNSSKIYEYIRENKECKYCDLYRNAYTGVVGYDEGFNPAVAEKALQELRCKRKGDNYSRNGTGCYTGTYLTCEQTGGYDVINMTGSSEYYEERYCLDGINGLRKKLGAQNNGHGQSREKFICLDESSKEETCIFGHNLSGEIDPNRTGIKYDDYIDLYEDLEQKNFNGDTLAVLNEKIINYNGTGYKFRVEEDKAWLGCAQGGFMTTIYKNYNSTCELTVTQQSNNILNLIESISKNRRTSTVDYSDVPRYLRWTIR